MCVCVYEYVCLCVCLSVCVISAAKIVGSILTILSKDYVIDVCLIFFLLNLEVSNLITHGSHFVLLKPALMFQTSYIFLRYCDTQFQHTPLKLMILYMC